MKSFSGFKHLLIATIMLFASVICPSFCLAWSLGSEPVEGILVLRNGNVLRGKLQQKGDLYHVDLPNGQIKIRKKQVAMVCQNIEEAYLRRRGERVGSTADSHLELAKWCLRHDLFYHAEVELREAQATDPKHPRLALLQRHLKHSQQMEQRKKQHQLAVANPPPEPAPLDPATLDKAPKWARALFVRQIQPLVVHSCATGGCHQGTGSKMPSGTKPEFHLNRVALDGAGHPEATLRNLAAMLDQIDWQAAEQSNLLLRARKAHGSINASVPLPSHKLQVLQGWVVQLAEAHRKETELRSLPLVAEVANLPERSELQLVPPQQTVEQAPNEVRPVIYEAPSRIDPFDPSAFNRRYSTTEKSPTQESAAE